MSKQTPEGAILRSILDYLAARHILAFRMNTGAVVSEYKGKNRFMRFGTPGMADVIAFPTFRIRRLGEELGEDYSTHEHIIPLWLEVKTPTGKQSEAQKAFQAMVEAEGHRYALVRSIDDVEELLR